MGGTKNAWELTLSTSREVHGMEIRIITSEQTQETRVMVDTAGIWTVVARGPSEKVALRKAISKFFDSSSVINTTFNIFVRRMREVELP
jgi:hypothetical protein